jgi:hypothetical protein
MPSDREILQWLRDVLSPFRRVGAASLVARLAH